MTQEDYDVVPIAMEAIFLDEDDFNCRNVEISYASIVELASSIKEHGLQVPVIVQPAIDVPNMPEGYDFRMIAGHRRYKAAKVAGMTTIACNIRKNLTEKEARLINLLENLERKDLNILQEAKTVFKLRSLGYSREDLVKTLNKSSGWVQVRETLCQLPESIQQEAAAGLLNQHQIKEIYSLRAIPERMFAAVRAIKDARNRGEARPEIIQKPAITRTGTKRKVRSQTEMLALMGHLRNSLGNGYWTRILAWCAGEVTDAELTEDLEELGDLIGKTYYTPLS